MDLNKKFALLGISGLMSYPSISEIDDSESIIDGVPYFLSDRKTFVTKNSDQFTYGIDLSNAEKKISNSMLKYRDGKIYPKGFIVLYEDKLYLKVTNDSREGFTPDSDTWNWDVYKNLKDDPTVNSKGLHVEDPSQDYYNNISVTQDSATRNTLKLKIQFPPLIQMDGSRIKFKLSNGSFLDTQTAFIDAQHVGFASFSYLPSRVTDGGIELHYVASTDVVENNIAYITVGIDLDSYDVQTVVFLSNNGHRIEIPVTKTINILKKGSIITEGEIYSIDENTPFGEHDITDYFDPRFNYGEVVNPHYDCLSDPIGSWKALPGSSGLVVEDDVKEIGLQAFGGMFPRQVTTLKAGLKLKSGEFYRFKKNVSPVDGVNIESWLNQEENALSVDYSNSVYVAQFDYKIPEDTVNILSLPNIRSILQKHTNEPNNFPPTGKRLVPGTAVNTGDIVFYSRESKAGEYTGQLDNYFGMNFYGVPYVWHGGYKVISNDDIRNYFQYIINSNGIPALSYIQTLQPGLWVSEGNYYIIKQETKFGSDDPSNYNGVNYVGKIYKATSNGEVIDPTYSDYSTVIGNIQTFEPSTHYLNSTPFPTI